MDLTKKDKIRFREKVRVDEKSGCWLWMAGVDGRGYGHFKLKGRMVKAHHVTHFLETGEWIKKPYELHHKCGVRHCCNPQHLKITRHQPHMSFHGRAGSWSGKRNANLKHSDETAFMIKLLHRLLGVSPASLAADFDIPERTAYHLASEKGRRHLESAYNLVAGEILEGYKLMFHERYHWMLEAIGEKIASGEPAYHLINRAIKLGELIQIPTEEIELVRELTRR